MKKLMFMVALVAVSVAHAGTYEAKVVDSKKIVEELNKVGYSLQPAKSSSRLVARENTTANGLKANCFINQSLTIIRCTTQNDFALGQLSNVLESQLTLDSGKSVPQHSEAMQFSTFRFQPMLESLKLKGLSSSAFSEIEGLSRRNDK